LERRVWREKEESCGNQCNLWLLEELKMDIENEYEGKIVLITGGAGCIGSNLCRKLVELNADKVVILDDLSSAYEWNILEGGNIMFVKGSVLDDEMLKRVFKEKPDYVFHLAAHFENQNSVDNPETDLMVNGMGTL
jgi:UDP-glucose 4-epimerase